MYLEAGKCAQCNKKLDDTYKHSNHNSNFSIYCKDQKYTPYFCSERCVEKILDERFIDDWGKPPTEELTRIHDLYAASIQAADSDAAVDRFMAEARQKIAEARSQKKQADSEMLGLAYRCKIACNIDPLRGSFASNSDPL